MRNCRLVQQSTERFLSSPPQVLFYRPFIGGASVVVPQCYQQNFFSGDTSLMSTYFMLRSASVLHALV